MASDKPEPCKSLASCQKRFLCTHKEADLALHPVVGLVLHVGNAENFPRLLVSKSWIFFFFNSESASRIHVFTAIEENGGDKRLVQLELACEADGVAPPCPF